MAAAQKQSWFKTTAARLGFGRENIAEVNSSGFQYAEGLSTAALMGHGVISQRARIQIYRKYQQMMHDPVVSGALRIHVTAALGGHETSGDVVFIEPKADARGDAEAEAVAKELAEDLGPIFNKIAMPAAYNGAAWGDSYARIYAAKGAGVVDASVSEMLLPPLVQPYKKGNKTVVCVAAVGAKFREILTMNQIAHLEMPRLLYTPQPLAVEKAWRDHITEDDPEKLPVMPSVVGGSFLADAETQYDNFVAAMQGLVGQRVLDSIDESMLTLQVQGMTKEQQTKITANLKAMMERSKQIADDAVKSGRPFLGRIRHILPIWLDKQIVQIQGVNSSGGSGTGRAGNIGVEDVLVHAKLLCAALGTDLTMLGFADMMSGGLGEGGFFRTSVQAAERSRAIRIALAEFFNHIADVHLAYKKGVAYEPGKRPWQINFYGSISALETERQRTEADAMNAGSLLVGTLTQLRDLGLPEKAVADILERTLKMDADRARLIAQALAEAKKAQDQKEAQQGGFGGPGGPGDGGGAPEDPAAPGGEQVDPAAQGGK